MPLGQECLLFLLMAYEPYKYFSRALVPAGATAINGQAGTLQARQFPLVTASAAIMTPWGYVAFDSKMAQGGMLRWICKALCMRA